MRGVQTLFTSLIEPAETTSTTTGVKPGRSAAHITRRDTRLLYRYYYYAQLQRRQYDDILIDLETEFDITQRRLIECLSNKHSELKSIFKEKPAIKELRQRYPFMVWPEILPVLAVAVR